MPLTFGRLLNYYRESKGMSVRELARRTKSHFTTINKAELDKIAPPPKDVGKWISALSLTQDQARVLWTLAFHRKVAGDARLMPYFIQIEGRISKLALALDLVVNLAQKRGVKIPDSVFQAIQAEREIAQTPFNGGARSGQGSGDRQFAPDIGIPGSP